MKVILVFIAVLFHIVSVFSKSQKSVYHNISKVSLERTEDFSFTQFIRDVDSSKFKSITKDRLYLRSRDSLYVYRFNLNKYDIDSDYYITLRDGFIYEIESKLISSDSIESYSTYSYPDRPFFHSFFYKSPMWVIPKEKITSDAYFYLKVMPHGANNRMEFFVEDQNTFYNRIELEYLYIGVYGALVASIIIVLLLFSFLKKEYSIIFFAAYISCALIGYLSMRGIGFQLIWGNHEYISTNYSLKHSFATMFLGLFYLKFYRFNKETRFAKKIFLVCTIIVGLSIVFNLIHLFLNFHPYVHVHIWYTLKTVLIVFTFLHIYLAYKKVIPIYLTVIFVFTLLTLVFFHAINPSVLITDGYKYFLYNLRHILFLIEVLAMTRFIFSEVIQVQSRYIQLQQANDELKSDFRKSVIEIQAKERNMLLNDVHDSFGGYLETVKIRMHQENASEKLQAVMDSFYSEYRMLLSNIYAPEIDPQNFSKLIKEYCDKVDKINKEHISCSIELENVRFSQHVCMHLYRIVSEGITNAIKHAKSSVIHLHISSSGKDIKLELVDNGVGIDYTKNIKDSYGINSIKDRVQDIQGTFELTSERSRGTNLIVKVPIS